jgi:hypothetical protein
MTSFPRINIGSRKSWHYEDENGAVPLGSIEIVSERIRSLLVRSKSPLVEDNFVQLVGIVDMASGLEYHYKSAFNHLKQGSEPLARMVFVQHDIVAWLNRLGQFYYFVQSELVKSFGLTQKITKILTLLPLRNKNSAHRSIDAPRRNDEVSQLPYQALTFSPLVGTQWVRRDLDKSEPEVFDLLATHYLVFQITSEKDGVVELNIELDHLQVLSEMYACMEILCE